MRCDVRQAKLIQAMQMGILHGKVEPDHPERKPARQEANSGRGVAECVSVPEEPYEGNPHVRFCEGGSRLYGLYPSTRPAIQKIQSGNKLQHSKNLKRRVTRRTPKYIKTARSMQHSRRECTALRKIWSYPLYFLRVLNIIPEV